jgi:plastocyanin
MRLAIIFIAIGATVVQARNFDVTLGFNGTLTFKPEEITANIGDTIQFMFDPKVESDEQDIYLR